MAVVNRDIRKGGFIVLGRVSIEEGFALIARANAFRKFRDIHISKPGGAKLYQSMYVAGEKLACCSCGWKATHFSIEKHQNEQYSKSYGWVANLVGEENDGSYAGRTRDRERIIRMMTQDHIVPVSLGGTDELTNLRCMCERCNVKRGNEAPLTELLLSITHPETYDGLKAKAYKKFINTPLNQLVLAAEQFYEAVLASN
jgi:hypothetical protein